MVSKNAGEKQDKASGKPLQIALSKKELEGRGGQRYTVATRCMLLSYCGWRKGMSQNKAILSKPAAKL